MPVNTCPSCGQPIEGDQDTRQTLAGQAHVRCPDTRADALEQALLDWARAKTAAGTARAEAPDWRKRGTTSRTHAHLREAEARLIALADQLADDRLLRGQDVA